MCHRNFIQILSMLMIISIQYIESANAGVFQIRPSLSVDGGYDSNPDQARVGDAQGETTASLNPSLAISYNYKDFSATAGYGFSKRYYLGNSELNYINHSSSVGATWAATISGNTGISIADTFSSSINSRETFEMSDMGLQIRRSAHWSNRASIAMNHNISQASRLSLQLSDTVSKNQGGNLVSSETDSAELSLSHGFTPATSANISYSYTNYHYPESDIQDEQNQESDRDDVQLQNMNLGITSQLSQDISLSLSGGISYSGEIKNDYDWTARALASKIFKQSSLSVSYSRGVTASSGFINRLNTNDRVDMRWNGNITREINLLLAGSYTHNESEPVPFFDFSTLEVKDTYVDIETYEGSIRADWRAFTALLIGLRYSYTEQMNRSVLTSDTTVTDPTGDDSKRHQVFLSLTSSFDGWRF